MRRSKTSIKLGVAAFLYSLLSCQAVIGDDTEVFFAAATSSNVYRPNVLFIFDTSGSMNRNQSFTEIDENGNEVTVSQSRIAILQDVMSEVLSEQQGVNMGLSRFSVPGGPILFPVTDPDEPADPIVLRSMADAADDAVQSNNSVTLDSDYLNPDVVGANGIIGLRFQNVAIPQGATILNSTLLLSTDIDSLDLEAEYQIYAEVVPNAAPFEESNKNLSDRISGNSVYWDAPVWDAEPIVDPEQDPPTTFESPDISSVLQQVVDLKGASLTDPAGWCGGNDLVILLKKIKTNGRTILSHDKNPDFSPKLRVDFDANIPADEFGCYANTAVIPIASGDHDAELRGSSVSTGSGDLDFRKDDGDNANNDAVSLRFEDLGIPQGADILSAKLNFTARRTKSGNASTTIYAVNSATPPQNASDIFNSSSLTAGVVWSIESFAFGVGYSSADISSIIEPIIALPGWSETSDMAFVLKDGSGNRSAYSFNGSASRAPELEISYLGKYDATAATKRAAMIATIEDFKATGNTPISDTYAEAALYFKGESVTYGMVRGSPAKRDNRISHPDAVNGALISTPSGCSESNPSATACKDERHLGSPTYISPIQNECQANHIVLLTDGAPTSHDSRTNDLYESWTEEITGTAGTCATNDSGEDCTIKMAGLLKNNDVVPGTSDNEEITTHTIGFYSDQEFLQDVADAGGGRYVTAFSKEALFEAINEIVGSILDVNTSFVSAGVTVNQYNRLTHNDQLYFSLFSPDSETVWPGNLKRYRLLDGELVDSADPPITAVNLQGEFEEEAQSFWSTEVDGNEVEEGGAAEKLTNAREVYSNVSSALDLTAISNRVETSNTNITEAMVGATDAADREKILNWAIGQDVNNPSDPTGARKTMGDPLHSQPTLMIYRTGTDTFRTSVYVGSNDGMLHSFDTADGSENWAFIPNELLDRLSEVQKDTNGAHSYGIDGSATLYVDDIEADGNFPGVVDPGEKAYLYIGMRRGGSVYYALDVSDPEKPKLLFKIDSSRTGYAKLGQTWSKPVVKKMKIPGNETVLIFGGGYDTIQDTAGTPPLVDTVGNDIFIADALDGDLIWNVSMADDISAGNPAGSLATMNAIPNSITAFDLDGDEYIDHFYAADTKAQVFRFDIDYDADKIYGGRVANLQGVDAANNRRFYNSPDISLVRTDDETFVSIAIGSGYRAHPLDETVTDYFYMVKDKGILNRSFDMDASVSSLVDVTNLVGDTDIDGVPDATELIESSNADGWYISFPRSGEKVITNSITFNNAVIFTTYTPPSSSGTSCSALAGTSRIYGVRVADGNPYIDTNFDGQLTEVDRTMTLTTSGIAPQPQVLLEGTTSGVKPRLCVGNQCGLEDFLPKPPEGVMGIRWRKNY